MGATDLHDEYLNTTLSKLEMIELEEPGEGQVVRFFSPQKICLRSTKQSKIMFYAKAKQSEALNDDRVQEKGSVFHLYMLS